MLHDVVGSVGFGHGSIDGTTEKMEIKYIKVKLFQNKMINQSLYFSIY